MARINVNKKGTINNDAIKKYKMLDTLSKDFQKEIAKHAQKLFDAANKRLKRIEQAKLTSPAYISAMKRGGKFSGRGLSKPENWNQLMREYSRVVTFLNLETSTLGGARRYEKKLSDLVGDITNDKREIIFDAFSMVEEMGMVSAEIYGSERLIQQIAAVIDNDTYTDLEKYERGSREYIEKLSSLVEGIKKDVDAFYRNFNEKSENDWDYFLHLSFDDES